ncbi:MAG TPA: glycosyltransferase [Pirellulaceae bacterium]|jgi:hypothetical protein|nr:glycosyltransferase [Pirellulaceae bacterium]
MKLSDCFLSAVLPTRDEGPWFGAFVRSLSATLQNTFDDHEIVIVDASISETSASMMQSIVDEVPYVRVIELFEAPDRELQCAAGLENAIGDVVVVIDPRTDPPDVVPEIASKALQGNDLVVGVCRSSRSLAYLPFSVGFRTMVRAFAPYRVPKQATMLRALSRRGVNLLMSRRRRIKLLFVDMSRALARSDVHVYSFAPGARHRKSLFKGARDAATIIVHYSLAPLRIVGLTGLLASLLSVAISVYALALRLFNDDVIEGWTSLSVFMSCQFTLLFLILTVYSEYMVRIVEDREGIHEYDVAREFHSSVMIDERRRNVTAEAEIPQAGER